MFCGHLTTTIITFVDHVVSGEELVNTPIPFGSYPNQPNYEQGVVL